MGVPQTRSKIKGIIMRFFATCDSLQHYCALFQPLTDPEFRELEGESWRDAGRRVNKGNGLLKKQD